MKIEGTRKGARGCVVLMAVLAAGAVISRPPRIFADEPGEVLRLFREGNDLLNRGRFADAVANYDRCLAADPHFAKAYFNRALSNEMVDRAKALEDWKRFVEAAADDPGLKWDVARAQARIQILDRMPPLPEGLSPSRYVGAAEDFYRLVAAESDGAQWRDFPVKVFLGSAPSVKWQLGVREAYEIWAAVFPVKMELYRDKADIRIGWEESVQGEGHAGEEMDWVRTVRVGDRMSGRRIALITVDLSRNWSKDEIGAIMLHEFGHALGIKGHSDSNKDIMFWQMQEKFRQIPTPILPAPLFWRSLVKKPSQRDSNTLIRLYNSAGYVTPLR